MEQEIEKAKWEIACLAKQNIKMLPAWSKEDAPDNCGLLISRQDAINAMKSDKLPVTPVPLDEDEDTVYLKDTKSSLTNPKHNDPKPI